MNKEVLIALADRWERDANNPMTEDGAPEAEIHNAIRRGVREGKKECADGLRMLIELVG